MVSLYLKHFPQAYGKKIVKDVPLQTRSGPVVYTNLIGFVPMLLLANIGNEYSKFWDFYWGESNGKFPPLGIFLLILGSLVGTGIGYSSWWCRGLVSATSFTLIGGEHELGRSFYVQYSLDFFHFLMSHNNWLLLQF